MATANVVPKPVKGKTPDKAREAALHQLALLGGQLNADEDVVFEGDKIVLPLSMKGNLPAALKFLNEKIQEDEQPFAFTRIYKYRPMDGARATANAIKSAFGFTLGKPIKTFFGSRPPELRDIVVNGKGDTEQVPWGKLGIPGLSGVTIQLHVAMDPEFGPVFGVAVEGPRKYRFQIEGLLRLIEDELERNSIYRGQPIDGQVQPEFLDLSGVDPEDVVFSLEVLAQLEANVWSPIRHSATLIQRGQPGKRSALFEGPYGTGKTLGAMLTAQVAVAEGWTFVYCRPGKDNFDLCMQTARLYQPSVLFLEDLDTLTEPGEVDHISRMLDAFDGLKAKGLRMLLVLTTNHVERLHKGMMRPGRLDAVIHIGAMDRAGVEKLARRVMGDALEDDVDFDKVYESCDGFMPAFVREAFDRAVRYSIARNDGVLSKLSTSDLVLAADGLRPQLLLMDEASDTAAKPVLEGAIGDIVRDQVDRSTAQTVVIDESGDLFGTLEVRRR